MEVQKRLYSIFRFNLYRLVSRYPWLLNPDVLRPLDEALYVDARFAADHKIDPVLASLHIGADAYQRQPAGFLLIADVGADHFHRDNPSFVVLTEVVKVSDPLFAWNLSRLHVFPPPRIDYVSSVPTSTMRRSGMRTISTGHLARSSTLRDTLPIKTRRTPVRPCDPITIRSAPISSANLKISSAGSPSTVNCWRTVSLCCASRSLVMSKIRSASCRRLVSRRCFVSGAIQASPTAKASGLCA